MQALRVAAAGLQRDEHRARGIAADRLGKRRPGTTLQAIPFVVLAVVLLVHVGPAIGWGEPPSSASVGRRGGEERLTLGLAVWGFLPQVIRPHPFRGLVFFVFPVTAMIARPMGQVLGRWLGAVIFG